MDGWITNDPEMAKKLRAIDVAYFRAREAAKSLPLAQKIAALRDAEKARLDAYETVAASFPEGGYDDESGGD